MWCLELLVTLLLIIKGNGFLYLSCVTFILILLSPCMQGSYFLFISPFVCERLSDASCQWNVWVPRDISAMTNSCVVIPCTFMYPAGVRPYRGIHGIWYFGQPYPQLFPPVVFKTRTDVVHESYKGRTKLLGDLHQRNCTLLINNIGTEHSGRYYFRADLGGANMYTYPDFAELKVLGRMSDRRGIIEAVYSKNDNLMLSVLEICLLLLCTKTETVYQARVCYLSELTSCMINDQICSPVKVV